MALFKRKNQKKTEQERVEERREEVLATGRKFKYPLQWTKHRVVLNTILISFVILAMIVISGWLALYRLGMTGELLFRITETFPLPVASVNSENVRFSDYLMLYRSSITPIERQPANQIEGSLDDLRLKYKREALSDAEEYTYAEQLAKELDITVTDEEITKEFERHLSIGGVERNEEGLIKIIEDNMGLNKSEYEHMLYLSILKSKVEIAIDAEANKLAGQVESLLKTNKNDYQKVVEKLGDKIVYQETGGLVGSQNIDGGRAAEAIKLKPGQNSGKFLSINGDGYYFVRLLNKKESKVDFVSIKVPFTEFDKRFKTLREEGKINELIEIKNSEQESEVNE